MFNRVEIAKISEGEAALSEELKRLKGMKQLLFGDPEKVKGRQDYLAKISKAIPVSEVMGKVK